MTIFEYVVAALLWIAGLAITRLLGDAVDTFRTRHRIEMHWIPVAWVGLVFLWQMQFLWAVFELGKLIAVWSVFRFGLLIAMAVLLFVAGALIVPKTTDDEGGHAWKQFLADGRWALVFLAVFFLLAFVSNPILFGTPLFESANLFDLALCLLLVAAQFARSKTAWAWMTLVFAVVSVVALVLLTPMTYS